MEEILYEKLDKRKRDRNNSHETLGQIMVDAGNEFGPGTSYGELIIVILSTYCMNLVSRKNLSPGFSTRSDTNCPRQSQRLIARCLVFR